MGGGVIQLSAVGAMDQYITGNPQITYFKKVYNRLNTLNMFILEQPRKI